MSTAAIAAPTKTSELGIRRSFLEHLALKIVYLQGELSVGALAEHMCVDLGIADDLFQWLRRERLVEVTGMTGAIHRFATTSAGRSLAAELLTHNQYAGPAPVSFDAYVSKVREQTIRVSRINPEIVEAAFQQLVLDSRMLRRLGTALTSGRTIFLYGPTGTGKTVIAEMLSRIFAHEEVWVPYAVELDGQLITVFDPHLHLPGSGDGRLSEGRDKRWVLCRRPRVLVGGELTVDMLDLQFNPATRFYTAPVQMKANNGVLIVDDFGRQRIRPEDLLNRWVVPLDRQIDFLALAGGKKVEVPFDVFVVFASNMDPSRVVDPAFLRRIQSKIRVDYVTPQQFHLIFRNVCSQFQLIYNKAAVDYAINLLFEMKEPLRACYPWDLTSQIVWAARYESREPVLDEVAISDACNNYFLESPPSDRKIAS